MMVDGGKQQSALLKNCHVHAIKKTRDKVRSSECIFSAILEPPFKPLYYFLLRNNDPHS